MLRDCTETRVGNCECQPMLVLCRGFEDGGLRDRRANRVATAGKHRGADGRGRAGHEDFESLRRARSAWMDNAGREPTTLLRCAGHWLLAYFDGRQTGH